MTSTKVPGRVLAWAALLVALVASVAANVAFARPAPGPRLSAGVAPVLVVLAAGLLERVPLGGIRWWRRWLAYGGLGVVVTAAFVTSFEHQYRLLAQYGNPPLSAALLPVAVDGLIVLASVCLTVIAERRRELAASVPAAPAPSAVPVVQPVPVPDATARPAVVPDDSRTLSALLATPVPATAVPAVPVPDPTVAARPGRTRRTATHRPVRLPARVRRTEWAPVRAARPPTALDDRPVGAEDELTAVARTVVRELTAAGRRVSRDALAAALRERGHRIGTDRAAVLARMLASGVSR